MSLREDVLDLLRENARLRTADLARMTDADEDAVADVIEDLEAAGIIGGYAAIVDPDAEDPERIRALVELNVTLDRETSYEDVAKRLVGFPEVEGLRLVSGDYDFALEVEGDSLSTVSRFVSEKVAPIPPITQTVTHYVMETYKRQGVEFGDRTDDDRLSVSP